MSHLPGDEYRVHYYLAGSHGTHTVDEIFDRWQDAKARRNAMFFRPGRRNGVLGYAEQSEHGHA